MHYGPKAFSFNGNDTITAKNGHSIGQRQRLSVIDVAQAKTMYTACKGGGGGTGTLTFLSIQHPRCIVIYSGYKTSFTGHCCQGKKPCSKIL